MFRLLLAVLIAGVMTLPADARNKRSGGGSNALKDAADDVKAFRDMPDTPAAPTQAPQPKSQEWTFLMIVEAKDGTRSIVPLSSAVDLSVCQMTRDRASLEVPAKTGVRIIQMSPCIPRADICLEGARDAFAKLGVQSFVDLCR